MLILALYNDEGSDRFKVMWCDGEDEDDEGLDITDNYKLAASTTPEGEKAWTLIEKKNGK